MVENTSSNPNEAIKDYILTGGPTEWKHREQATDLEYLSRFIGFALFSSKDESQPPMSKVLVGIGPLQVNVLGAYHLVPDSLGLTSKITIAERWITRPTWELCETLTHEMVHVYQNEVLEHRDKRAYHNKEFVGICEDIGLHPKLGEGWHTKPADGMFARLMDTLGIERPAHAKVEDGGDFILPPGWKNWFDGDRGGRVRGTSTLTKYIADGCIRPKVCNFRAGLKDLQVKCSQDGCAGIFRSEISN